MPVLYVLNVGIDLNCNVLNSSIDPHQTVSPCLVFMALSYGSNCPNTLLVFKARVFVFRF